MITLKETHQALYALQAMNLNFQGAGQAEFWAPVLNEAMPEIDANLLQRAVNRLGASRDTNVRQGRVTPADILDAVQEIMHGDLEAQRSRLKAEIARNGAFQAEGIEDATSEVTWRQEATKAFMAGMSRQQAEKHAWEAIGQTPPAIEPTTKRKLNLEKIGR